MTTKQIRIEQTNDELRRHLKEQLGFLNKSAADYDKGDISEGKRIATTLRTLLHDTAHSTSLLKMLNIKNSIQYLDSCHPNRPENLCSFFGLVSINITSDSHDMNGTYTPLLNSEPPVKTNLLGFETWWTGMSVIKDQSGGQFTRKDLILNVANTDGGAHIDTGITQPYHNLSRCNSLGVSITSSNHGKITSAKSISHIELASIRQIAFEFNESITKLNYL